MKTGWITFLRRQNRANILLREDAMRKGLRERLIAYCEESGPYVPCPQKGLG